MFIDHLRAAVEAADTLATVAKLERIIWQDAWPAHVSDDEASALAATLHGKRKLLGAADAHKVVGFTKPRTRKVTGPQKAAAIARRRRLAACWPLPPAQAAQFTISEQAALRVIADELRRYGVCTMFIEKVAAIAGTCRSVVKTALRKAKALRLLTVEERRRAGRRSLTNVVRFLCSAWKNWIVRKGIAVIFPTTTNERFTERDASRAVERYKEAVAGKKIAIFVPP